MKLVSGSLAKTLSLALFWATLSSMVLSSVARAETIGLSLPLSGRYAPVAEKVLLGARLALEEAVKTQSDISLQVEDDACSPDTANKVGANLFAAKIIIGPMCFDTARQLAEVSGKNVIALCRGRVNIHNFLSILFQMHQIQKLWR